MKSYGHLNPAYPSEYPGAKRASQRKWCLFGVPVAVVVLILIIVVSVVASRKHHKGQDVPTGSSAIRSICSGTLYPDTCTTTLNGDPNHSTANPKEFTAFLIKTLQIALNGSISKVDLLIAQTSADVNKTEVLTTCGELLDEAWNQLGVSLTELNGLNNPTTLEQGLDNLQTWLSASATYHDTCLEELVIASNSPNYPATNTSGYPLSFTNSGYPAQPNDPVTGDGDHIKQLYNIVLYWAGYLRSYSGKLPSLSGSGFRKLLSTDGALPGWADRETHFRRLLDEVLSRTPDAVVPADGSIQEAVDNALDNSDSLYIIQIPEGTFKGQVKISKKQTNLVFLGAGIDKTILKDNQSVIGGTTTFRSATLAVNGAGFLGIGFTVQNDAGPENHQAVAIRVSADKSALFQVKAIGYQDTMYAHSFRQFYSQCIIQGTVDFLFGNGAAFFQNSTIIADTGLLGQQNTFTAQGRTDPGQNTGLVFQDCDFIPSAALDQNRTNFLSYLGRPWKNFSRTILLHNTLDSIIQPVGWLPWNGDLYLDTLYYAEYDSQGPGGGITSRAKWPGVHQLSSPSQVQDFLVNNFIDASTWLPSTTVTYYPQLNS